MVLGQFVTICAWGALILTISGLVLTLRKSRTGHRTVVGQIVGAIATILLALGMLLRAESPVYLLLTFAGCVLAFLSLAFVIRSRAS